jgi:hypothetical protein
MSITDPCTVSSNCESWRPTFSTATERRSAIDSRLVPVLNAVITRRCTHSAGTGAFFSKGPGGQRDAWAIEIVVVNADVATKYSLHSVTSSMGGNLGQVLIIVRPFWKSNFGDVLAVDTGSARLLATSVSSERAVTLWTEVPCHSAREVLGVGHATKKSAKVEIASPSATHNLTSRHSEFLLRLVSAGGG